MPNRMTRKDLDRKLESWSRMFNLPLYDADAKQAGFGFDTYTVGWSGYRLVWISLDGAVHKVFHLEYLSAKEMWNYLSGQMALIYFRDHIATRYGLSLDW